MTASKYNAHTEPLFKQLNIMKVADNFQLQCLKFYHKFKIKSLPAFFDNIFMRNSDTHPMAQGDETNFTFSLIRQRVPVNA